jgi:hypothetical protein
MYYDANIGRFTSKDSWEGNYNSPHSLNRWNYTYSNPINYTDPSGYFICSHSDDPDCIRSVKEVKKKAKELKVNVENGTIQPVEALAQLVDFSKDTFQDTEGMMWG